MEIKIYLTKTQARQWLQMVKYRHGHDLGLYSASAILVLAEAIHTLHMETANDAGINSNSEAWFKCQELAQAEINNDKR